MYNIKTETTILSFSTTGSVITRPFTMLSHISIFTAGGVGISCLASANKAQLEVHEISVYWCAFLGTRAFEMKADEHSATSERSPTPKPFLAKKGPPDWMRHLHSPHCQGDPCRLTQALSWWNKIWVRLLMNTWIQIHDQTAEVCQTSERLEWTFSSQAHVGYNQHLAA